MTEDRKPLAILTSGGDAPGMNMALWAAAVEAKRSDRTLLGYRRGYAGVLEDDVIELEPSSVLPYARRGGTILGTARVKDLSDRVDDLHEKLAERGIQGLIVLGGDGSLAGADRLVERGFTTVGIAATIDDDVDACNETLGFDTAQAIGVHLADGMRDSAESLPRVFSLETLGGDTGMLAQAIGEATCADVTLRPENPMSLREITASLKSAIETNQSALVVASEGYPELSGVLKAVEKRVGLRIRDSRIGHAQRGGSPSPRDRRIARTLGEEAVRRCLAAEACLLNPIGPNRVEALPWRAVGGNR